MLVHVGHFCGVKGQKREFPPQPNSELEQNSAHIITYIIILDKL